MFNKNKEPVVKKDVREEPVEVQVKEAITYHHTHQPKPQERVLSSQQFFKMMNDIHEQKERDIQDGTILGGKPAPHARLVIMKDKDETIEDVLQYSKDRRPEPGKAEPVILLIGKDDKALGQMNLHNYLEYIGTDQLVDLVNSGQLSMTSAKLPEAIFNRVEDGDEKGTDAFAGVIATQGDVPELLSVHYFTQVDDLIYYDFADDAEREAILKEEMEEKIERETFSEEIEEDRSGSDMDDDFDPFFDDPNLEPGDNLSGLY